MPLKEINYNTTHFNRIVCKDLDIKERYVGHTADSNTRKCQHKKIVSTTIQKNIMYVFMNSLEKTEVGTIGI